MLIALLFVALPVGYVHHELADYTSPTRVGKPGKIKDFTPEKPIQ
jgi:hypothetical protein